MLKHELQRASALQLLFNAPLQFNDGQPVPDTLVGDALLELRQRFGAVTWETQIIRGLGARRTGLSR